MIITLSWLKDHLITNANLEKIIDKLTSIGLEVEGIKGSEISLKKSIRLKPNLTIFAAFVSSVLITIQGCVRCKYSFPIDQIFLKCDVAFLISIFVIASS